MRTVPVSQSDGPLPDGCDLTLLISTYDSNPSAIHSAALSSNITRADFDGRRTCALADHRS